MYNISRVMPAVIKYLLIANVLVFILDMLTDGQYFTRYGSLFVPEVIYHSQIWRIVSYMFIHSQQSFSHILFNMLMLWMFGSSVVASLGQKSFLYFYVMAGAFAGIVTCGFDLLTGKYVVYIGASGAILAVVVFFGCYNPNQKLWIWGIFPLKAKWMVVLIVLGDIFFFGDNNIASISHLAGAFFGGVYYFLFFKQSFLKWRKKLKQFRLEDQSHQQSIIKQADVILQKVSNNGLSSLTVKEKLILEKYAEIRKNKDVFQIQHRKNFYGD